MSHPGSQLLHSGYATVRASRQCSLERCNPLIMLTSCQISASNQVLQDRRIHFQRLHSTRNCSVTCLEEVRALTIESHTLAQGICGQDRHWGCLTKHTLKYGLVLGLPRAEHKLYNMAQFCQSQLPGGETSADAATTATIYIQ